MAAAVPALPAPAVVLPVIHEIAWQFQDAVGNTDDENARGSSRQRAPRRI